MLDLKSVQKNTLKYIVKLKGRENLGFQKQKRNLNLEERVIAAAEMSWEWR